MYRPPPSLRNGRAPFVVAVGAMLTLGFAPAATALGAAPHSPPAHAAKPSAHSASPNRAGRHSRPCDAFASGGTPCVAAHSTVRALYSSYDGPLYQVSRASDLQTTNIGLTKRGGYADSAAQDTFCADTTCTISTIFDQSPQRNDLVVEAGDRGAAADALPVHVGGHKVYGLKVNPGVGYRHTHAAGVATNGRPESMYMVAGGPVNDGCCFDYGNTENTQTDTGEGHMDALNYSAGAGNLWYTGGGPGPWVMADMENGVLAGGNYHGSVPFNPQNAGNNSPIVTGMLKNDGQTRFVLKGGNSSAGRLTTWYNGPLPDKWSPMHQEGSIVLGTGGDNSQADVGSFFEGAMTAALTKNKSDNAAQQDITAAYKFTGIGDVSVGPAGTVVGVTPDHQVVRYRDSSGHTRKSRIPGKKLTRVAVRSANDIWGVDLQGAIWRRMHGRWAKIAGQATDIAAASDGTVWRTDATGVYAWTGKTNKKNPAVNWRYVPGSSVNGIARVVQVSGRSANDLWGVSSGTEIWHYDGTAWTKIGGNLSWVSEGSDGTVEGVAFDYRVYRYTGGGGLPFVERPGPLAELSVGSSNDVWGVNTLGDIFSTTP